VELADAKTADPNSPMLGGLEHRLKMALEPPTTSNTGKSIPGPTNDELDRMIRGLPRGAIESFTQSVQPVLMNHCATAGCHGPQSETGLRLFRVPTGKTASRRITQRNLYSALMFVDRDNPASSRLLSASSGPHGTAKIAIFSQHEAGQYKRLVDWTGQLAGHPVVDSPATVDSMFGSPAPAESVSPPPQVLSQEARKARALPKAVQAQMAKMGAGRTPAKPTADATPTSADPSADPFDPEAFNRRYATRKSPPAKPPAQ
jgi:hypothetical protein